MVKTLEPGIKGEASVRSTQENTAERFGSGTVKVFATPALVALMEKAAVAALAPYLDAGEATVGTRLDVRHIAATPVDMNVRAAAELIEVSGKKLIFEVTAFDEKEQVGIGRHERYVIRTEDFLRRANAKRDAVRNAEKQ